MTRWHEDPAAVRPMLASLEEPPLAATGLIYELKYDGIRALADVRPPRSAGGKPAVALYSRNGREKHAQFPAIVGALEAIARDLPGPVLLDGEIVAMDPKGGPLGFQHIQGRIHLTASRDVLAAEQAQPAAFIVFDLLRDGDEDLRPEPLAARRLRLQARIRPSAALRRLVRLSEIATDDGGALMKRARDEQWEGLIAKDGQSVYRSGRRTPAWRKMKLLKQQEFVIGGWTEPRQTRHHFGALLVGYFDAAKKLRWAGSVGTGFNQAELDRVAGLLQKVEVPRSPFDQVVKTAERAHWVRPKLIAEVRFTEWTSDGLLRQPVYLGLRTDKKAADVVREIPPAALKLATPAAPRPSRPAVASASAPRKRTAKRATADDGRAVASGLTPLIDRLTELESARRNGELTLPDGTVIAVTNLAKLFWPTLGLTKGDLMRYYVTVAPLLLPLVDDRPLVMKRFPNGVGTPAFYQQRHPEAVPAGVRRMVLPAAIEPITEDGPRDRLIGGSLATLLYMTQLAAISQDPWFSRVDDPLHPDFVAIDLDPGDGTTFATVIDVARWVKDELDRHRIPGYPKTSGASGLHIYIPLPKATTYDTGQLLCQMIATLVAHAHPRAATVERMVKKRQTGTVYVDYLQNILGKTIATAYSARASDYAGVSTPLRWEEIRKGLDPREFTIRTAPARFAETGDLWRRLRESQPVDIEAMVEAADGGRTTRTKASARRR
ncbi:MAG: DNA ligase D [Vicinamibacterales bacterium]